MKQQTISRKVVTILLLSSFWGCNITNPLDGQKEQATYFPLAVGNAWHFDDQDRLTWRITKSFVRTYRSYCQKYYQIEYPSGQSDWIRADASGNIYLLKNGKEYLWFAFSKKDGDRYRFDLPVILAPDIAYYYFVSLYDSQTIETPAGIFLDCKLFIFDIPEAVDDDIGYYFARNVGPVKIAFDGWGDHSLHFAVINGDTVRAELQEDQP